MVRRIFEEYPISLMSRSGFRTEVRMSKAYYDNHGLEAQLICSSRTPSFYPFIISTRLNMLFCCFSTFFQVFDFILCLQSQRTRVSLTQHTEKYIIDYSFKKCVRQSTSRSPLQSLSGGQVGNHPQPQLAQSQRSESLHFSSSVASNTYGKAT